MRALSLEAFVDEAGASRELVERLVEAGTIVPLDDGRFDARDEVVASTAQGLLDAGIGLDQLAWSLASTGFGFSSVRAYVSEPAPRTEERWADIVATLGPGGAFVPAVYGALGLHEPDPGDHPRTDEAALVTSFIRFWSQVDSSGEAHVRVARLVGDAMRRIVEGWAGVWDEVARPDPTTQGAPTVGERGRPADPGDPNQNAAAEIGELGRRLVTFAFDRQLEATLHGRVVWAIERVLGEAGLLPPRPARPPAVAFVDLSGFTDLVEQHGDETAALAAARLYGLADEAVRSSGGRVVKQLGDGVLLRFPDAERAIRCVRDLVPRVAAAGLPAAHAGIAAGPVVVRDGDVFGRTVNLASRLSGSASPGETLVEEGVVVALPAGTATWEPVGRIEFDGIAGPIAVWRLA